MIVKKIKNITYDYVEGYGILIGDELYHKTMSGNVILFEPSNLGLYIGNGIVIFKDGKKADRYIQKLKEAFVTIPSSSIKKALIFSKDGKKVLCQTDEGEIYVVEKANVLRIM